MKPYLPDHLRGGVHLYINEGIRPGSFLTAVLENNLKLAVATADYISLEHLADIVCWLEKNAPVQCWGSEFKVSAWVTKFRRRNEEPVSLFIERSSEN